MDLPWAARRRLSRCFADCSQILRSRSDSVVTGAWAKSGGRGKLFWRRWRTHADVSSCELDYKVSHLSVRMYYGIFSYTTHQRPPQGTESNIGQLRQWL